LKIVRVDSLDGNQDYQTIVEGLLGAPVSAWSEETTPTVAAMIKDDAACTRCALCAERCPTYAITMESFRFDEILSYEGIGNE
jgi:ferredoxin